MDKELMTMMLNMENNNNPYYHNHHFAGDVDQKTSLGFMELLGFQDYDSNYDSMTAYHHLPPPASSLSMEMEIATSDNYLNQYDNGDLDRNHKEKLTTVDHEVEEESSVVLNGHPSSPNSCSISSPAHQRLHNPIEQTMGTGDETKTKKKRKDKQPRFAFMTRTEIDHLDDGYRWRKYGQKAVKNSHFPRSYYRCTNASCNVKKRVERCMGDSSYIITTYEGKHNHQVSHKSPPLIPSFNHHLIRTASTAPTTRPTVLKVEQGGLLQDMLPCHH